MQPVHINRRKLSLLVVGGVLSAASISRAQEIEKVVIAEKQCGDPSMSQETLEFDPYQVQSLFSATKATFRKRDQEFSSNFLKIAQSLLGVSRTTDRDKVAEFLETFNLPFASNGKPVPYCAAGLSHAAALSYLASWGEALNSTNSLSSVRGALSEIDRYHFYPSPSVVDIYNVALGKRRFVARTVTPKPGWLVIYDWSKNGGRDHVGIVESVSRGKLHTIEFNTSSADNRNGGAVSRRVRTIDRTVVGYVRTDIATFV